MRKAGFEPGIKAKQVKELSKAIFQAFNIFLTNAIYVILSSLIINYVKPKNDVKLTTLNTKTYPDQNY